MKKAPTFSGAGAAAWLVMCMASTAAAQEAAPAEESPSAVIVPEARLKGSTDGEAQLAVTLGYQQALSEAWDRQIRVKYEIGTQGGLATLFAPGSGDLGASAPWKLGVTYSFMELSTPYTEKQKLEDANIKARAWCTCAARCSSPDPGDKPFCDLMAKSPVPQDFCDTAQSKPLTAVPQHPPHPFSVDSGDFCPVGIESIKKETPWHRFAKTPHTAINIGFSGGRDEFKYLSSDGGTPPKLTSGTKVGGAWQLGATAVWLKPGKSSWLSYEALAGFSSKFEPSTDKARWCAPKGTVEQDGQSFPAENCKDTVIGAPSRVQSLEGAFYFGNIDQKANTYRVAAGVQAAVPLNTASKDKFRLSFSTPIYINLLSGNEGYKGIVRVGPTVTYANKRGGGSETTFAVSLALLGQRQMFTREFDAL